MRGEGPERLKISDDEHETVSAQTDSDSDVEVTSWTSGVKNHLIVSDDSDSDFDDMEFEVEYSDDEMDDLEGEELIDSLRKETEHELSRLHTKKINEVNLTLNITSSTCSVKTTALRMLVVQNTFLSFNPTSKITRSRSH